MNQILQKKKTILIVSAILLIGFGLAYHSSAFGTIQNRARGFYYAASNGKEQFRFTGTVKATIKGKAALTLSIRSFLKESQIILFVGRVMVGGKITPQAPGTALPTKMRILVNHKSVAGKILKSNAFDVNVQSNGAILMQSVPFNNFDLVNPKETLDLSVVPFDRNLPAGTISLNITHVIGASATNQIEEEQAKDAATVPERLIFVFDNYLSGHAKNELIGPLLLKTPGKATFFSQGTLRVAGKITPFDAPGLGLPNRFMMILKHKLQQGAKLVKTENFIVNVGADGRILPQVFPVNGLDAGITPDQLEVSMKYLDKDIPDRIVNVTFTFTSAS